MQYLSDQRRVRLVLIVVCLACVAGILLSFRLWTGQHLFPLMPLPGPECRLPVVPSVVYAVLLPASLLVAAFYPRSRTAGLAVFLLLLALVLDQNRCQPWVYLYLLLLLPYCMGKHVTASVLLSYSRILLIAFYGWSGIHKLNSFFPEQVFRSILTGLFHCDTDTATRLLPLGYGAGAAELLAALLLLFPRSRKAGIVLVICIHLFILLYLSPLGIDHNQVVFPWNAAMMLLCVLLFYSSADPVNLKTVLARPLLIPLVVLIVVLPGFHLLGCWDSYLSFSLYSGTETEYYVAVADEAFDQVDPALRPYFKVPDQMQGGYLMSISDWSYQELNVPAYTTDRLFRKITASFCSTGIPDSLLYFVTVTYKNGKQETQTVSCRQLPH